jgi:8-oxo-dGTP pyrophosphatase MutT (NUDIX family)
VSIHFDAPDPAAVPIRDAATVMLLRDGPAGIEVSMLRRNLSSDFVGGAYVFPGGAVDPHDAGPEVEAVAHGRSDAGASELLGVPSGGLAYWVAAIRESFEEAGLLLAYDRTGAVVDLHDPEMAPRFAVHRAAVDSGERRLVDVCREEGLRLAVDALHYFARWITPLGAPRRYDTRFFVAHAPEDQTPVHDEVETIAHLWIRPEVALERHRAGNFELILPTVRCLEALSRFGRADEVVGHAASLSRVEAILPTIREAPEGLRIVLPGDEEYDAVTNLRVE